MLPLIDPETLGRDIYDFWIQLLRTDKAVDQDSASWADLDETFKEDFVKSVRANVTDILQPYLEQQEAAKRRTRPTGNAECACYTCDRYKVSVPGDLCAICASIHLPRNE